MALAHQLAPDRRHHVGLARARIAENTQIGRPFEELTLDKPRHLGAHGRGKAAHVQRCQRLVAWQFRLREQPRDASLGTLLSLNAGELVEVVHVTPSTFGRLLGKSRVVAKKRRQPERF